MDRRSKPTVRRVLIASANPLFGQGLQKILLQRHAKAQISIKILNSMEQVLAALKDWQPHLAIVDYDDHSINRNIFLDHFVEGDAPMQVMLASLQASGAVVVYDRRMLTSAEAEAWLNLPWNPQGETADGKAKE